jgi:hypothetical protein
MIKQNLQVAKPRARPIVAPNGQRGWRVHGLGIECGGHTLEGAYRGWVENYINKALYGDPRPVPPKP